MNNYDFIEDPFQKPLMALALAGVEGFSAAAPNHYVTRFNRGDAVLTGAP